MYQILTIITYKTILKMLIFNKKNPNRSWDLNYSGFFITKPSMNLVV